MVSYEEAIEVFRDLVRREPKKANWPYMLGYQYYGQEQWKEALTWFDRAVGLWDGYLVALYRKGYAHTRLGETQLAKQAFQTCIGIWQSLEGEEQRRQTKHYSDACFQLGKILLSRGQSRNAENVLSEAVEYDPSDAHKHYGLGKALLKLGKTEEALGQFQTAYRIEPNKDYISVYVARAHIALQQYQQAEAVLEQIPARQRRDYVWQELGKLRLGQRQPRLALKALEQAVRLNPRNHNHHYFLGQAYETVGHLMVAHKEYEQAIRLRQRHYDLGFPEAQERLTVLEQNAAANGIELAGNDETPTSPDGYIKTFKGDRGLGFISREDRKDVFFHVSDVANPADIEVGAGVTFQVMTLLQKLKH